MEITREYKSNIDIKNLTQEFSLEFKLENFNKKAFKKLFKLPRKKKKKLGKLKAKKRLLKRIKLGYHVTFNDFKRAGYKLTICGGFSRKALRKLSNKKLIVMGFIKE